jgi:hypothetical protein
MTSQANYKNMSEIDLQTTLIKIQQDFRARVNVVFNEQARRDVENKSKFQHSLAGAWAKVNVQENNDSLSNVEITSKKVYKKVYKNLVDDIDVDHINIINDIDGANAEEHAFKADKKIRHKNKKWESLRKDYRNPLQKKIQKVARAGKRLYYNQQASRDVFKTNQVEYTAIDREQDICLNDQMEEDERYWYEYDKQYDEQEFRDGPDYNYQPYTHFNFNTAFWRDNYSDSSLSEDELFLDESDIIDYDSTIMNGLTCNM